MKNYLSCKFCCFSPKFLYTNTYFRAQGTALSCAAPALQGKCITMGLAKPAPDNDHTQPKLKLCPALGKEVFT